MGIDSDSYSDSDSEMSSPRRLFDIEAGLPAPPTRRGEHGIATTGSNTAITPVAGRCVQPGALDSFLKAHSKEEAGGEVEVGDLLFDGHVTAKVPSTDENENESFSPPGNGESRSLTSSLAAAVPTNLRSSRRQSLPGAFRMSLTGATPPGADTEDDNDRNSDDDDEEESVGFRTGDAHEVLIEATLVCDRSQATNECAGRPPPNRSTVVHHTVPPEANMDLVEAKPLHRFCLCCEMLGSRKSICFIILVIVAIAGVAVIIERNRQVSQTDVQALGEAISLSPVPSMAPTSLHTLAPTSSSLGTVEEWTTMEQIGSPTSSLPAPETNQTVTKVPSLADSASPTDSPPTGSPTMFELPLPGYTLVALDDPVSPQSLAYSWLLLDPQRDEYSTDKLLQRFALATFYFSLMGGNNTSGENDNWLSYDKDECEWYLDIRPDQVCSTEGEYQSLHTNSDRPDALFGTLPRETWMLTSLVSVSLFTQDVKGALTDEIGGMSQLEELELFDLSLSGSIPSGFGELKQLTSLKLQKNEFQGSIPTELSAMIGLQYLYLDESSLSGALPTELGQLTELKEMVLHSNSLSGTIPSEFVNMSKLERIYLSENDLTGPLPLEAIAKGSSSSLYLLELGNNMLSGSLSSEIGLLTSMVAIDLFGNIFSGTLPNELGQLQNVSTLLLDSNTFSGLIPSSLGNLSNLSELWLHNNNFTGAVPPDVCNLKQNRDIVISIDCLKVSCDCECTCGDSSSEGGAALKHSNYSL